MRKVWFHRVANARRLSGGYLKQSHYFHHVQRMPGFTPRITFGGNALDPTDRLGAAREEEISPRWEPTRHDLFFLGGSGWLYLAKSGFGAFAIPRISLIQGLGNALEDSNVYPFLENKAIWICVSQEVADAVLATGRLRGPVFTFPNGIDLSPVEGSEAAYRAKRRPLTIAGYKRPDLARGLSRRLDGEGIAHLSLTDFFDRGAFLGRLAESRVAVCLPREQEGFYLVALEAMAAGCVVVTVDCIGNRGFCHHEANCLIAEPGIESLFRAAQRALDMPASEREALRRRARHTVKAHSLEGERARFHAFLADVDCLWRNV